MLLFSKYNITNKVEKVTDPKRLADKGNDPRVKSTMIIPKGIRLQKTSRIKMFPAVLQQR